MNYKKITIKGKGKESFSFVGIYIGKFERVGENKLYKVDELRTSKGSQLKRSFQIWHTDRNQYVLKILKKFSLWQVLYLDSISDVRKWLISDEMYDDLARYASLIRDLEPYALPRIQNIDQFKKQKVRSANWRKPLEKPKTVQIAQDLFVGEHDFFTQKHESKEAHPEIDKGDVLFTGFDEAMINKFVIAAENQHLAKQNIINEIKRQKK